MAHIRGFGGRGGFGRRPALVVIDMTLGFTDPESPLACDLEGPVSEIQKLLEVAREAEIPIIFTTVAYREVGQAHGRSLHRQGPRAPHPGGRDALGRDRPPHSTGGDGARLNKLFASGFFGTGLSSLLTAAGVDTLIITGASTSGCVRATAVDALQYGFRPVVPREAVGDRNPEAHEANLYDVDAKYGDVVSVEDWSTWKRCARASRLRQYGRLARRGCSGRGAVPGRVSPS